MTTISLDLETFSDVDLNSCGVYKYAASPFFNILLFAYSVDGGEVQVIDLMAGQEIPEDVLAALTDPNITKYAYNAIFERVCLSEYLRHNKRQYFKGYGDDATRKYISPRGWKCTMTWAAYMGLPLSLRNVGLALKLDEKKMEEGKDEYIIVDEEADVVRWIFNKFLESRTIEEVMTSLYEEKGISIPKPTISDMLKNVKYAGDVVTVKRYVINHLTHSVTINRGEHEQILIEDHHEAIVDRELFQRVQEKRQRRFMGAKFIQYPFGSLPKCPYCGEVLHRRRCLYRDLNGVWICDDENCGRFAVLSKDLEQAAVNAYNASNQEVGEITQAEKWWVDQLVESLTIETCETGTYLTVIWKNGESNRVEIPIDKETPEYILEKERSFKIRHGMEM